MAQTKSPKSQSKTHTLKIIAVAVAFIMWGITLFMNALLLHNMSLMMESEQIHYGKILQKTDIIDHKVTNDEESRRKLKDWYDIDYKKD